MLPENTVCDVLVAGSGAGGLSAAIVAHARGLDVLVAEKEPYFGGTTARSGGWLWVPGNPIAEREGVRDRVEDARTYIAGEAGEFFDPAIVDAYLEHCPRMVSFFLENTCVKFTIGDPRPDYHLGKPGTVENGRSVFTVPFDGKELGSRYDQLNPPMRVQSFWGLKISIPELHHFFDITRSLTSAIFVLKHIAAHVWEIVRHGRRFRLVNGRALAGRLAKSAFDLGIPLWLSSEVRELITEGDVVRGAVLMQNGKPVRVLARRGVVLACGGFPQDTARMRGLYAHRYPGATFTLASPASVGDTGDGIRLGEAAGGQFDDRFSIVSYTAPCSFVPFKKGPAGIYPHFFDYRKPGILVVTRHGKRFVDEGSSYHDVAQAIMGAAAPGDEVCAFIVCDHRAIRRYGIGFAKPSPIPLGPYFRSGYLLRSSTIDGLAKKAGIEANALVTTIEEFNRHAREGRDPHFGRGGNVYGRMFGDPLQRPNPCLAALERPPYYAVKVVPGNLATFAGLRTNCHAQVLNKDRKPIGGLYAVGNDMASLFGGSSPGAGSLLGPAMTFGYLAALHLAGKN